MKGFSVSGSTVQPILRTIGSAEDDGDGSEAKAAVASASAAAATTSRTVSRSARRDAWIMVSPLWIPDDVRAGPLT